jgi:hypothetical protein
MQTIPADILEQFSAVLKKRAVPVSRHGDYRKWLRYCTLIFEANIRFRIPNQNMWKMGDPNPKNLLFTTL